MKPVVRSALWFSFALMIFGCSRTGGISGDVFLTMKSGDVKRAAGAEVLLIPVTPEFQDSWRALLAYLGNQYSAATAEEREATSRDEAATSRETAAKRAYEAGSVNSGWDDAIAHRSATLTQRLERAKRVLAVLEQAAPRGRAHLREAASRTIRTDVNARYEFKDIPAGKYYVCASHRIFDNQADWMIPVTVERGVAVRLDLSNANLGWEIDRLIDSTKRSAAL
jgi:hypothetical protein